MTAPGDLDPIALRAQFPALARREGGQPVIYLDGPAGSQVPDRVIQAVLGYLSGHNANTHGAFATSGETDRILAGARAAMADLVGVADADEIVFGPNATTLVFALSRALARTWSAGDEVVVTELDHDANVTPWVLAARDAGAAVRTVKVRLADTTIDLDDLARQIGPRTRLVAVTAASNATGTTPPVAEIARMVHAAGAELMVDAVHAAPHRLMDVAGWGCDYVVCSVYKFFGPHVGVLWGRSSRMRELPSYHLRAAGDELPDRWSIGTQNHEGIAGAAEAVEYLADLGRHDAATRADRRAALVAAYARIRRHEEALCRRLLTGLAALPAIRVWGIADPDRVGERAPTVSFTHARRSPADVAAYLAEHAVYVWHGHYYAVDIARALGREPDGMVRVGLLHYNTADEVDRLLALLAGLA